MKTKPYCLLLVCLFIQTSYVYSQNTKAEKKKLQYEKIQHAVVDSLHFEFIPEYAISMSGNRYITDFFLKVSKTKIESYLPYYGVANQADYASKGSPFTFTTTDFTYTVTDRKKGGWYITIEIPDLKSAKRLVLNIFDNGKAILQVLSSNWQPMSYNGYVQEATQKQQTTD